MPPADPPSDQARDGVSPILPGRPGRRSFSLEAIRERIEAEFIAETQGRADILAEGNTPDTQRSLIEDVADYVLAVENLFVPPRDKAALVESLRQRLFSFGPLDNYLNDDQVTEIAIEGPHSIHIREGMGKLTYAPAAFDDTPHLGGVLARILAPAGIDLSTQPPALETGLILAGRRARLSLVGPPISAQYSVNIRLHPRQRWSLDALIRQHNLAPAEAASLLRAIVHAGYGLLIVGEVGTGKTTLLNALLDDLRDPARLAIVARGDEIVPPQQASAITPHLPDPTSGDLSDPIRAALDDHPAHLALDELRGNEATS